MGFSTFKNHGIFPFFLCRNPGRSHGFHENLLWDLEVEIGLSIFFTFSEARKGWFVTMIVRKIPNDRVFTDNWWESEGTWIWPVCRLSFELSWLEWASPGYTLNCQLEGRWYSYHSDLWDFVDGFGAPNFERISQDPPYFLENVLRLTFLSAFECSPEPWNHD